MHSMLKSPLSITGVVLFSLRSAESPKTSALGSRYSMESASLIFLILPTLQQADFFVCTAKDRWSVYHPLLWFSKEFRFLRHRHLHQAIHINLYFFVFLSNAVTFSSFSNLSVILSLFLIVLELANLLWGFVLGFEWCLLSAGDGLLCCLVATVIILCTFSMHGCCACVRLLLSLSSLSLM